MASIQLATVSAAIVTPNPGGGARGIGLSQKMTAVFEVGHKFPDRLLGHLGPLDELGEP